MSIAATLLTLASERGLNKTICPSEVARHLWPGDWRKHMEEVRTVAFALRDAGKVVIMQKGEEVSGDNVKGPIRIKISSNAIQDQDL